MAGIQVRGLSFKYPTGEKWALDNLDFEVSPSEFVVICGKSGCGKSTLLRQFKKNLTPYGDRIGEVLYDNIPVGELDDRRNATDIGFVQQNPDNQLVTDKVWHELAFGLESLGLDNQTIKRRVAEMASFFDIQGWFRKNVADLSGGQKQLLNLASIMAMQPEILILDEPTSQLDPIAADEFLKTIYKINRELGTTVIISEHRLEELFTMADRVIVMEGGKIIADASPTKVGEILAGEDIDKPNPMFYGLPAIMKIYAHNVKSMGAKMRAKRAEMPLTIREGRLWLEEVLAEAPKVGRADFEMESRKDSKTENKLKSEKKDEPIISLKDLWFRYSRESSDVLRGLNLDVNKGEFFCLLGGNGVGKSTTLKAITGIIKPQMGSIFVDGLKVKKENFKALFKNKLSMLPQNPQALFTELSAEEELLESLYREKISDVERVDRVEKMLEMMEISHLRKSHPYDLSGGEQQRLALGKILLLEPTVLLLDEPTKGLDPFFKITLSGIFQKLKKQGVTIFMVSHDVEFCAEYADKCAMFFDGDVVSVGSPKEFFAGNSFYTTSANRLVRRWYPEGITWEEVSLWIEKTMIK